MDAARRLPSGWSAHSRLRRHSCSSVFIRRFNHLLAGVLVVTQEGWGWAVGCAGPRRFAGGGTRRRAALRHDPWAGRYGEKPADSACSVAPAGWAGLGKMQISCKDPPRGPAAGAWRCMPGAAISPAASRLRHEGKPWMPACVGMTWGAGAPVGWRGVRPWDRRWVPGGRRQNADFVQRPCSGAGHRSVVAG